MIDRKEIQEIIRAYDTSNIQIGVLASHSALDTCDGAVDEGFKTVCYCQNEREKTYSRYFRSKRQNGKIIRGCVDQAIVYNSFKEILAKQEQQKMVNACTVFIPNRSFTAYCGVEALENEFRVPIFGSRNLLASEERGSEKDYYWLLDKAKLPYPKKIDDPKDIQELVIVKLPHAEKKLERGFFTAASYKEYLEKSNNLLKSGVITQETLNSARIEKYIVGPVFNFDFFYSPLEEEYEKLELLGIDWRFESSLDGHVRLPAPQQMTLNETQSIPEYTVCGHSGATVRESLLEPIFKIAEKWVIATKKYYSPGIIGPFCLQTTVDKDLKFAIYDVAPRIGGGTNYHLMSGHPYGNSLWRKRMSTGRRTACEIRRAIELNRLEEVVT